jgi:ubiquinone/menaquinone biosynthesis C-methylase UbiE
VKHGDFTGLATDYAQFRPGYAPQVATAVLSCVGRDAADIDAADIGAGTGIWTRVLADRGLHSVVAVEPNDEMRRQGIESSRDKQIVWRKGSAEATGLPDGSADLVSMASSLHWADFDKACDEFHRRRLYANVLFRTVTDEFITGVDKRSVILVVLQTPVRSHAGRRKAILRQFE